MVKGIKDNSETASIRQMFPQEETHERQLYAQNTDCRRFLIFRKWKNRLLRTMKKQKHLQSSERGVHAALETYSNVHRGSGHNSMVSTHLFEQARDIVLEYLGLNKDKYVVIFCTPRRAELLKAHLKPKVIKVCQARTSACHWV